MQQQLERLLIQRPVILQILRFGAIGVLNTSLDIIVFNFTSKTLNIQAGLLLGTINLFGAVAALIQSYFWNRHWTFASGVSANPVKNFWRLAVVGGIGAIGLIAVILGARSNALPLFYLIVLALFLLAEVIAWIGYGIGRESAQTTTSRNQFVTFVLVSVIGLIINSVVVAVASHYLVNATFFQANADLLKNVAKIIAVGLSLIWNFIGYKLIVFKK